MPIDPDHQDWNAHDLTEYGCMQCDMGNFQLAISYFDLAISKDPTFKNAWYSKGGALISLEEFQQAVPNYEKVLELDPGDQDARIYLRDLRKHIESEGL